jgi:hypothetical protein
VTVDQYHTRDAPLHHLSMLLHPTALSGHINSNIAALINDSCLVFFLPDALY